MTAHSPLLRGIGIGALIVAIAVGLANIATTRPDPQRCQDDLVSVGLANIAHDLPASRGERPDSCAGLTEASYGTARHDAAVRIAAAVPGRTGYDIQPPP